MGIKSQNAILKNVVIPEVDMKAMMDKRWKMIWDSEIKMQYNSVVGDIYVYSFA